MKITETGKHIIFENDYISLTVGKDGKAHSLKYVPTGEGKLFVPISTPVVYRDEADGNIIETEVSDNGIILPVKGRYYLETILSKKELEKVFFEAKLIFPVK